MGATATAERHGTESTRRRRPAILLAVGAVGVALGLRLAVDSFVLPPDRFRPNPAGIEGTIVELPMLGDTLAFQVSYQSQGVRPTEVELVVADGSSVVAATVVACRARDAVAHIGSVLNPVLADYCDLADPTEVEVDGDETYLLAIVQPLTAGRVVVDGIRVTHARGPFHRTEHTGETVEITVG